ncbi:sialic acid-binding Ig-like lectin 16 [Tiliqua scincoides]|uniref:sialic acid-binding Ig-like lectin 16 n=1 Tax=Tiliqua scincoides TaxID=71010 RepID=UPI0034618B10
MGKPISEGKKEPEDREQDRFDDKLKELRLHTYRGMFPLRSPWVQEEEVEMGIPLIIHHLRQQLQLRAPIPRSKRMPSERRTCQLTDPPWKEKNWASLTTTVAVLILTFLCKGMQSQQVEGYTLTAPANVLVQRGLCVHIPCTFTYPGQSYEQLYVYWFRDVRTMHYYNSGYPPGLLVATNDERETIGSSASGRFRLTGDPEQGDCSFRINDATSTDRAHYYFRIIKGESIKFSYRNSYTRPRVDVTELMEKPEIRKSSELLLGKPVTISCQAPGTCSGIKPQIYWTSYFIYDDSKPWQQPHSNGSMTYGSNITFTPSEYNKGQVLTCRVTYGSGWPTTENTIRVDIAYAPQIVHITVNITSNGHLGSSSLKSERDPVSVVAQEGNNVSLVCQANSIPDPLLSWTKWDTTLNDSKQAKEHYLLLPKIRPEDTGLYQCQAKNLLGSVENAVRVTVQYPPRTVQLIVSQTHEWDPERGQDAPRVVRNGSQLTAREGNTLQLSCKADGHPPVEVSWVKEKRTVKQWSSSPDNWLELSSLTIEDKGEYTCLARNTLSSVQSTFQLDIAFAPKLIRENSTCWHENNDFLCTCALQSWPPPQIRWQVEGETLSGNSSSGSLNVTSWLQGERATSRLRLNDSLDKDHSIICLGNNSVGVYTMQFLLSSLQTVSKLDHHKGSFTLVCHQL